MALSLRTYDKRCGGESATENIPPATLVVGKGEMARQELTALVVTLKAW